MNRKTEKAFILDDKGNILFEKGGTSKSVQFNLKESRYFVDNIFIHNHPGASSFSLDDINIMVRYRMKEIRAVGVDYQGNVQRYIIKPRTPGVYPKGENIRKDYKVAFRSAYSRWEKIYKSGKVKWEEAVINIGNELWTEVAKKNKELIYISEVI